MPGLIWRAGRENSGYAPLQAVWAVEKARDVLSREADGMVNPLRYSVRT